MHDFERRRSQETFDYKKSTGSVEHSMLGSMMGHPAPYDPRALSQDLQKQMEHDSIKKRGEKREMKEKVRVEGLLGGVGTGERQKMLKMVDKRLGISNYMDELDRTEMSMKKSQDANPEVSHKDAKPYMTPRVSSGRSS